MPTGQQEVFGQRQPRVVGYSRVKVALPPDNRGSRKVEKERVSRFVLLDSDELAHHPSQTPSQISTMVITTQIRTRGRPAHTRGSTFLSYTPDGSKLITVGSNNTTRVYKTGSDGEPTNIDDCPEQNTGVASTVKFPWNVKFAC